MRTMRFVVILVFSIVASARGLSAQGYQWQRVMLDDSTSVEFPDKAEKKQFQGQQSFVLTTESSAYVAMVQQAAFDADPELAEQNKFYESVLKGAEDAMHKAGDVELVAKKPFTKNGFVGLEVQFISTLSTESSKAIAMRFILVNGTFYTQSFVTSAETVQSAVADRNHFFESFQPQAQKKAYAEPGTRSQAYKLGRLVGNLAFYGVLLIGIIALVRRFSKPKKAADG